MKRSMLLAAVVTTSVLIVALASGHAQQPSVEKGEVAELFGKILAIYDKTGVGTTGWVLQDAALRELGGRRFLVGVQVDQANWAHGRRTWVAWDTVASVVEFDSLEQYRKQSEAMEDAVIPAATSDAEL